jgi:hypothetical protein
LIYLDPPFNSNRNYNVLFKDESGTDSQSQITAFEDTWHWNLQAEQTYNELINEPDQVGRMIESFRQFIGTNQMMAYLTMMAIRLKELHRVLKVLLRSIRRIFSMQSTLRLAFLLVGILTISGVAASNAVGGTFVATKQVQLETKTFLLKLPVEAQRGERWVVLKRGKNKVTLTFGPDDARREAIKSAGMKKLPEYEINAHIFASSFVPEYQWPEARKALASDLQRRFRDLSIEECEKIIEGELWIGMSKEQAAEAVGNRVLSKEIRESKDGKSESWRVGAFSLATTAKSTATSYVHRGIFTASPSRPMEPLDVQAERDRESNTRLILTFEDDVLSVIVRR